MQIIYENNKKSKKYIPLTCRKSNNIKPEEKFNFTPLKLYNIVNCSDSRFCPKMCNSERNPLFQKAFILALHVSSHPSLAAGIKRAKRSERRHV